MKEEYFEAIEEIEKLHKDGYDMVRTVYTKTTDNNGDIKITLELELN